jgi:hypothetical protein
MLLMRIPLYLEFVTLQLVASLFVAFAVSTLGPAPPVALTKDQKGVWTVTVGRWSPTSTRMGFWSTVFGRAIRPAAAL